MMPSEFTLKVQSETETGAVAEIAASLIPVSCRLGLSGELGAGKTSFVRAFLKFLQPSIRVQSPSYVLEQVYRFPNARIQNVSHWDLYRLKEGEFPEELREAFGQPQLTFVEWPERSKKVMDLLDIHISLGYPPDEPTLRADSLDTRFLHFQVTDLKLMEGLRTGMKQFLE